MRKFLLYFVLLTCSLAFVQPKEAKLPQGILRADKIDIDWDKNTLTAYPNPTLTLPDTQAQAKQITVYLNEKGNIEKIIAEGSVLLKIDQVLKENIKQEIEGKAEKATLMGNNILLLEGGAEAKVMRSDREGTSLIKADKISVDMEKKSLKAEGNVHLEFPLPSPAQGQK
jgi:lipopolysaccharide export system protein LptA